MRQSKYEVDKLQKLQMVDDNRLHFLQFLFYSCLIAPFSKILPYHSNFVVYDCTSFAI